MRNLLALGAAGLIGFAGIGWYLGWYQIQTTPTATGRNISIDLNTPKIKEDVGKGKEKLRDYLSPDDNKSSSTTPLPIPQTPGTPTGFLRGNEVVIQIPNVQIPNIDLTFAPAPPSGSAPKLPTPR